MTAAENFLKSAANHVKMDDACFHHLGISSWVM
jgi:hypothetical protein